MFWIHVKNVPTQCATAQLVVDEKNDITLGAFNKNTQKVTNSCCSTAEQANVYHGVATWSCQLQKNATNLKILVWGDGFEKSFQGFAVEAITTANHDVVLSLTDDFIEFQAHVEHPILPVSQVGLVGPVGPIEPVGPVGPLTQYLLKYIIQYHLAQALGQPAPKLPNDIQLDAVNLQDPRTLVDMARRIAQELDDQKLGKILDHMNCIFTFIFSVRNEKQEIQRK
eukprot:Phypoly_transcript_12112.p1 GENE.Phypoly_transcript_12112~~Phypoly_transcript_12112.p1  ORF type:complete len:225 (+),score=28.07 Phypoly_transcript_12112:210-884(+)